MKKKKKKQTNRQHLIPVTFHLQQYFFYLFKVHVVFVNFSEHRVLSDSNHTIPIEVEGKQMWQIKIEVWVGKNKGCLESRPFVGICTKLYFLKQMGFIK